MTDTCYLYEYFLEHSNIINKDNKEELHKEELHKEELHKEECENDTQE